MAGLENETFIRLDNGVLQFVQQSILKTVAVDDFVQNIIDSAGTQTRILPSGCVFHALSKTGDVEYFIMERPIGLMRMLYQFQHTTNESIEQAATELAEMFEVDTEELTTFVLDGRYPMLNLRFFYPNLYTIIERNAASGAIINVRSFTMPNKKLESKADTIYASKLSNSSAPVAPYCLGSTPKAKVTTNPQSVVDYINTFYSSAFNEHLDSASVPKTLQPFVKQLRQKTGVVRQDACFLVWHAASKSQKHDIINLIQKTDEWESCGTFGEMLTNTLKL